MTNDIVAAKDIHKDAENELRIPETYPKFDHNFLVAVQTSQEVPAVEISKLVSAFNDHGIAAEVRYVGTIDYDTVQGPLDA